MRTMKCCLHSTLSWSCFRILKISDFDAIWKSKTIKIILIAFIKLVAFLWIHFWNHFYRAWFELIPLLSKLEIRIKAASNNSNSPVHEKLQQHEVYNFHPSFRIYLSKCCSRRPVSFIPYIFGTINSKTSL